LKENNCGNCKFAFAIVDDELLCRRLPPTPVLQNDHVIAHFPRMFKSGWCGEYRARLRNVRKS